jgi:DNA-binding NarL/FixJ family response regulator
MSEDFHFLWIDDAPSMKQAAANLAAITDAEVGFHLSDDGLAPEIDKLMHEHVPDLVIVDHKLNWDLGASGTSLKATGATVAELIKDLYPQVPVVCVTKVDVDKEITYAQKSV